MFFCVAQKRHSFLQRSGPVLSVPSPVDTPRPVHRWAASKMGWQSRRHGDPGRSVMGTRKEKGSSVHYWRWTWALLPNTCTISQNCNDPIPTPPWSTWHALTLIFTGDSTCAIITISRQIEQIDRATVITVSLPSILSSPWLWVSRAAFSFSSTGQVLQDINLST